MNLDKVKTPKYNPYCFSLARNTRGLTAADMVKITGIKRERYLAIESGQIAPTDAEVELIGSYKILNYPVTFFKQWQKTSIAWNGFMYRNVEIDYYEYKVFRDLNPRYKKRYSAKIEFNIYADSDEDAKKQFEQRISEISGIEEEENSVYTLRGLPIAKVSFEAAAIQRRKNKLQSV